MTYKVIKDGIEYNYILNDTTFNNCANLDASYTAQLSSSSTTTSSTDSSSSN